MKKRLTIKEARELLINGAVLQYESLYDHKYSINGATVNEKTADKLRTELKLVKRYASFDSHRDTYMLPEVKIDKDIEEIEYLEEKTAFYIDKIKIYTKQIVDIQKYSIVVKSLQPDNETKDQMISKLRYDRRVAAGAVIEYKKKIKELYKEII